MESEDERLAREASVVPAEQSRAEGESGVLEEIVDESEVQQSQLSSSSKRKIKKRRTARDKTYKPTVEDEADEADVLEEDAFVVPQIIAEGIARVEEVLEEFEEPEEKKKGKRKVKAKGIEKTVTFEVKKQPIAELETTTPESKACHKDEDNEKSYAKAAFAEDYG
ncbi:hypothetical protein UCRNP2_6580 [Neofusicoccum parvum UCRNP2]|uniref:Uncharacterized protein n=1 Tax=Botryosphaeria parva (strain UCR-NP2) TaxID=1287680 RepID=R1GEJ8_BOTPV|nr:hypothetical protein UCRNP2_6580 [Neofusicoccum parvum UCRNP2]